MSYIYKKKKPDDLEQIADIILGKTPNRINGFIVNIEGIVEDFGITILPRAGGLHEILLGYTAKDPRYIITAEAEAPYPPLYRAVVAEEFAHIVLEYDLYKVGSRLPEGSQGHELTVEQLQEIEEQALHLACAVLMPKTDFTSRFRHHQEIIEEFAEDKDKGIRAIVKLVAEEFEIYDNRAGRRASDLKLITHGEYVENFVRRIPF